MNAMCKVFGHKYGKPTKVYGNFDWVYNAKVCERCDKRVALSPEDDAIKQKMTSYVSGVMNASRAEYGLPPISWER